MFSARSLCLLFIVLLLLAGHANAFGAGNIASISKIEGQNWRHGDIEDVLKTLLFIKHHKWTSMTIKRVYFGNWLRDYSQAVDVGTLKGTNAATIRILVWILSFMSFGYATAEFEVTDERLGVYRPEEHIDNPKDYADNVDARQYDPRLRPPVMQEELMIDPETGMKNYIANERGQWATSTGYIKHSFARSIHFGRVYTNGAAGTRGKEADLCEALRCLGQGLHCLEDFGAHTNYTELALREMGFHNVFPHVGTAAQINLQGKQVYPLVTGTFGGVDFLHSVLGEVTDHVTQSEVDEMNKALGAAAQTSRGTSPEQEAAGFTSLLSSIPGTGALCQEAVELQRASDAQAAENSRGVSQGNAYAGFGSDRAGPMSFAAPPTIDAQATIAKIYPIMEFRDKVVRAISSVVSVIPGLESLIEKIQERVTMFIMGLLAPYIQPLIKAASANLKLGSSTVIDASGKHQFEPWTDPNCTDPTHSLLSKDHFSNILNPPAGLVASELLKYAAPRVLYAWENPGIELDQVLNDIAHVFHHPALRNPHSEIHSRMFSTVEQWAQRQPNRGAELNNLLSSESVKQGKNHIGGGGDGPGHSHAPPAPGAGPGYTHGTPSLDARVFGLGSHSKVSNSPFAMLQSFGLSRELDAGGENLEAEVAAAVQASQSGGGGGGGGTYHQSLPQQQQAPYPADYTPASSSTYGAAYAQGYTDAPTQSQGQGQGQLQVPPLYPPQHQQQGYGDSGDFDYRGSTPGPYPPQWQQEQGYEPYGGQQQQQWGGNQGQGQGQGGYGYGYGQY